MLVLKLRRFIVVSQLCDDCRCRCAAFFVVVACELRMEEDLHNHLLARQQAVGDELASSDGDLSVSHDCSRWESRTAKRDVELSRLEVSRDAMTWCERPILRCALAVRAILARLSGFGMVAPL